MNPKCEFESDYLHIDRERHVRFDVLRIFFPDRGPFRLVSE